jgi:hypothetical protein
LLAEGTAEGNSELSLVFWLSGALKTGDGNLNKGSGFSAVKSILSWVSILYLKLRLILSFPDSLTKLSYA